MPEHRNNSRPRPNFLVRKSVLAANIALFAFAAWGFAGEFMRNRALDEEIAKLEEQARMLEADNLEIAKLGERLAAKGEIERDARLKLNLMKPGETVVVVREAPPAAGGPDVEDGQQGTADPTSSNPEKWWRYFFHDQ